MQALYGNLILKASVYKGTEEAPQFPSQRHPVLPVLCVLFQKYSMNHTSKYIVLCPPPCFLYTNGNSSELCFYFTYCIRDADVSLFLSPSLYILATFAYMMVYYDPIDRYSDYFQSSAL